MRALLFDVDGVVLLPPRLFSEHLIEQHGAPRAELARFFAGDFQHCLTGERDLRDLLPDLLDRWNWPGTLDHLLDAWFEAEYHPNTPLLQAIQDLRKQGQPCFLATNQEQHRARKLWSHLQGHFDGMFASSAVGARKPDPQYFRRVQEQLAATEVFFWDDHLKNVEAAGQLGWQAHLYTTPAKVLEVLQSR